MIDLKQKYKNEKRGYNFIDIENPTGTRTAEFHTGQIHYKSGTEFKPINTILIKTGSIYKMNEASYSCEVPEYADNWFKFTNKFGEGLDSFSMKPIGAQHVLGSKLDDYTIWYENAMGSGISLRVTSDKQSFKKEFILSSKLDKDIELSFELTGSFNSISDENTVFSKDDFNIEKEISSLKLTTNKDTFIRTPYISDSSKESNQKEIKFKLGATEKNLKLTKVLPKEFLSSATYPVYTDDTITYTPPAGDGYVQWEPGGSTSWATAHDSISGTEVDYTSQTTYGVRVGIGGAKGAWKINRAFLPFITSGIPIDATINSASLIIFTGSYGNNNFNDGSDFVSIIQTSQPNTGSLTIYDYNNVNSVEGINTRLDISSISTLGSMIFTLNASGISWINPSGTTLLGALEGHDLLNYKPAETTNSYNYIFIFYSENALDPQLIVTYSGGGAPPAITSYPMTISLGTII